MNTPKEKANELIGKYFRTIPQIGTISSVDGINFEDWNKTNHLNDTKKFALLEAQGILNELTELHTLCPKQIILNRVVFWTSVKEEILNS